MRSLAVADAIVRLLTRRLPATTEWISSRTESSHGETQQQFHCILLLYHQRLDRFVPLFIAAARYILEHMATLSSA